MKNFLKSKYSILITSLLLANFFSILGVNVLGFFSVLYFISVPGYLLLCTVIPPNKIPHKMLKLILSVSLSILIVYVIGLVLSLLNTVDKPINYFSVMIGLNLTTILLAYTSKFSYPKLSITRAKAKAVLVYSFLFALPVISGMGAIRLNNGATPTLTLIVLLLIGMSFMIGLVLNNKFKPYYIPAIYSYGLSVLLATSLRGTGVIGHDIQNEFLVFTETLNAGRWTLEVLPSAYNACLSITILPAILATISGLDPAFIYKFVYQFIFALVPVGVFIFANNFINSRQAFMAAFIFISFPTFINDMPMLLRQEVALLFFVSLLLVAFIDLSRKTKAMLSILLMLGIILSHYSTAYITIGMLFVALIVFYLFKLIRKSKNNFNTPLLNPVFILIAGLFLFIWNVQTTNISSGLVDTFTNSAKSILIGVDNESGDVAYSIFGKVSNSNSNVITKYIEENNIAGVTFVAQPKTELTKFGESLDYFIEVTSSHQFIRKLITYSLQILFLIGITIMLIRNHRKSDNSRVYLLSICIAFAIFLTLMTVLPQVSVNYGVLRLFQQALVVISIPIIVAIVALFHPIKKYKYILSGTFIALIFLHLSGFLPTITGGLSGQLNTHNSGLYYDAYMKHASDRLAGIWVSENNRHLNPLFVDRYAINTAGLSAVDNLQLKDPTTLSDSIKYSKLFTQRNITTGLYMIGINSNQYYYVLDDSLEYGNTIYSTHYSEIRNNP